MGIITNADTHNSHIMYCTQQKLHKLGLFIIL